ncbi:DUF4190 domain-containing protein [Streptomyces sp. LP05-1]|uniref:DUF4190 domain-containing protein n=1 Tax=Streptomyces pyxinae TaxID=2970734 RepID=A0ABT2CGL3_9ACTN|nr:DUF4190 domain-containing protein [Streptomyces sp. LP05-1]MCS0636543.1 DUF4190 domain-containing protein [Streptomyces sp. LP05-1]
MNLGKPPGPTPPVHDQQTVTSMPSAGPPPAGGPGPGNGPGAGPAYPGGPGAAPGGATAIGGAVPPPPIAPGGPAQPAPGPYGYPAPTGTPPRPTGFGGPGHPGYPAYPAAGGYPQPGWGNQASGWGNQTNNGMGTAALVLGIISVVGFCLYGFNILLGILALIFGIVGRKRVNRGEANNGSMATAGIVLGAVGIVIGTVILSLIVWAVVQGDRNGTGTTVGDDSSYSTSATSLGVGRH